ncbi:hypothetical protein [Teredinibacter turnerae]|uniref:hypothetical protein n=1 Tax=Teredinibacter turnerae TaxID=2426 RepID=UPI000372DB52|nr:hypothetical protein [Teredinibacter turnerae]
MKQVAIRKHYSYFKTDSAEIDSCSFDENLERLDEELRSVFKKYGLEMVETETRFLPINKLSIHHCEKCNHLMVNRDENPTKFDDKELFQDLTWVVLDGGSHEGQNLCEECLPITHRWGHYS